MQPMIKHLSRVPSIQLDQLEIPFGTRFDLQRHQGSFCPAKLVKFCVKAYLHSFSLIWSEFLEFKLVHKIARVRVLFGIKDICRDLSHEIFLHVAKLRTNPESHKNKCHFWLIVFWFELVVRFWSTGEANRFTWIFTIYPKQYCRFSIHLRCSKAYLIQRHSLECLCLSLLWKGSPNFECYQFLR